MNLIVWIIIGGLAGRIAGTIMKNRSGLFMNVIIGVVGAFIGGWLFDILQIAPQAGFSGALITATVGAVVLLFGLKLVKGR